MAANMKKLWLYAQLTFHAFKTGFLAAFEYRTAFFMQVIGMIINDAFFIILWAIFFTHFPEVRGWTEADNMVLISLSTTAYGLVISFCGGWNFSKLISLGELDQYLSLPKSLIWQLLSRRIDITGIGDLIFGIIVYLIWGDTSLLGLLKFTSISLLSAACIINFVIIVQSLAFYLGHIEEAAAQIVHLLIGFSLYPQNQFNGLLKLIMMTVIPAFYITSLPVALLKEFNWLTLGIIIAFWLVSLLLAILVFKKGLKKYESGNLIGVKI